MKQLFIITLCIVTLAACDRKPNTGDSAADDSALDSIIVETENNEYPPCLNSVAGHDEIDKCIDNIKEAVKYRDDTSTDLFRKRAEGQVPVPRLFEG